MGSDIPHISIIIVNYNVKEYLANLLSSLEKAKQRFDLEIFVVDNASKDGSKEYIPSTFPFINYIYNEENVGFGKANNQAIQLASGKYILIINPDTLVSEDTLSVLHSYMEAHEDCGACGCKILNPDGTFAPESRRSIPTIRSAASKVLGLNAVFPKSKVFAEYYLGWLGEDEASDIPVLSGSFMFYRAKVLKELEGFDERFFMYGEDIDLCFRTTKLGYRIYYNPETSIIHYKGESTKKGDLKYVRLFNKANYQFFEKHYTSRYSLLFKSLIYLAITFKGISSFVSSKIEKVQFLSLDIILLNLSLLVAFLLRFSVTDVLEEKLNSLQSLEFLWVNLLLSGLFIVFGIGFNIIGKQKSIPESLKTLFLSYSGVTVITFFARELAFSRIVLALSFIFSALFLAIARLVRINRSKVIQDGGGRLKKTRLLIVGDDNRAKEMVRRILKRPDWDVQVIGHVSMDNISNTEHAIGHISQLRELVRHHKIDQVFFMLDEISYKDTLSHISRLRSEEIIVKIVPEGMDFILGKSKVEYIDSIPVVELDMAYEQSLNKALKRLLDICISVPAFLLYILFVLPALLFNKSRQRVLKGIHLYKPFYLHKNKNLCLMYWYVLIGRLSLVGSPIYSEYTSSLVYKKGITGPVQSNFQRIDSSEERESFELNYLQNYSIWIDIDILMKSLLANHSVLHFLGSEEDSL